MKKLSAVLFFLFLVTSAEVSAQTSITFNGTISFGPDHVGDSVSWTITTTGNPLASKWSGDNYYDESLQDVDLLSNITGTGVTGTWTRPSANWGAPWSSVQIQVDNPGLVLTGTFSSDSPEDIGLSIFGNKATAFHFNTVTDSPVGLGIDFTNRNYSNVFNGLAGNYSVLQGNGTFYKKVEWYLTSGYNYTAIIQSIKIDGPAVPEPSTYGLCLGGLALAAVAIRRRRKA